MYVKVLLEIHIYVANTMCVKVQVLLTERMRAELRTKLGFGVQIMRCEKIVILFR
jgi:hypothetical protein